MADASSAAVRQFRPPGQNTDSIQVTACPVGPMSIVWTLVIPSPCAFPSADGTIASLDALLPTTLEHKAGQPSFEVPTVAQPYVRTMIGTVMVAQQSCSARSRVSRDGLLVVWKRGRTPGRLSLHAEKVSAPQELVDNGMSVTWAVKYAGTGRSTAFKVNRDTRPQDPFLLRSSLAWFSEQTIRRGPWWKCANGV